MRLLERVLGRDALLAGRLRSFAALRMTERFRGRALLILLWREQVLDGSVVLAGRSGTFLTCLPAVAGRAPTVSFGDCLPAAAFLTAAHVDDDDTATGADDFTARADGAGFASCADGDGAAADDFAERAEDDDDDGVAAIVVASPKSTANASLVVSGAAGFTRCSAGFLRLRLRARFWGGGADLVAAAFCFLDMGVYGARRADDWRLRQARDVVESEDRAEKRVVMCGAEEFAGASRARTRQPHGAAQAERYDGDAVRRHAGLGSTGDISTSVCRRGLCRKLPGARRQRREEAMAAFLCSAGILPAILNFGLRKRTARFKERYRDACQATRPRRVAAWAQAGMPVLLKGYCLS